LITIQRKRWREKIVIAAPHYRAAMAHPKRAGFCEAVPWHPPMALYDTKPTRPTPTEREREAARLRARQSRARARDRADERKQAERDQIARWIEDGATCPIKLEPITAIGEPEWYGAIRVNGRMYFLNRAHWWRKDSEA
jgi:hypothetical protein